MNDDHVSTTNALPPFIAKTYEMVDDSLTDSIVSWSRSNKSFVVWNPPEFCGELLPRFFKHNNFSSFIRQLNTYGFRKIDPELWEFANDYFIRGEPGLLKNIHRRKPVHSHSIQNHGSSSSSSSSINVTPLTEFEKDSYVEKINNLQLEKKSLSMEFNDHQQEHERLEIEARGLTDRLKRAAKTQNEILSSLDEFELMENGKRRLSVSVINDQICPFNIPVHENVTIDSLLSLTTELVAQLESSLTFWEQVLKDVDDVLGPRKRSLECADGPTNEHPLVDVEMGCKGSEIDAISEPENVVSGVKTGVNDVFWEQFLTENPGGSTGNDVQEVVESGRNRNGKFWWKMRSVNSLAYQLGQLTPAEKI